MELQGLRIDEDPGAGVLFFRFRRRIWIQEQAAEPADGSQVPHAGSRFGEFQGLGDFLVRELLVVPHVDDFRVNFVETRNGLFDLVGDFLLGGSGGGRDFRVVNPGGQIERRAVGRTSDDHGLFAVDAAFGRDAMAPVRIDNSVFSDLPEP